MHARMTRYEGGAPEAMEETLQAKKGVLPWTGAEVSTANPTTNRSSPRCA